MGSVGRQFLKTRAYQREWMDAPDIEESQFTGALDGLRRVNVITRSAGILWPYLREWSAREHALRVLDVGCGGGDTAIALAKRFARRGVDVQVDGCDLSGSAIEYARERAERSHASCRFFQWDVKEGLPGGYDVIMCSLFLHHLEHEDAVAFLRDASAAAARVLVQDLVRSLAGWWLAYVGVRLLMCNAVCQEDGPRSVECAFTPGEARALAEEAGLGSARVERHVPFRYVLRWEKAR